MKNLKKCYLLITLLFIIISFQTSAQEIEHPFIDRIEQYLQQRDFTKARQVAFQNLSDNLSDPIKAELYFLIGESYQEMFILDSAQIYLQKQKELITKLDLQNTILEADAYFLEGKILRLDAAYQKALESLNQAKFIYLKQLGQYHAKTGEVYRRIGICYGRLRNEPASHDNYKKALAIFEKIYKKTHPRIADIYNNLGNHFRRINDFEQSMIYHEKALKMRKEVLGKLHPITANSYFNLALIYKIKSDFVKALELNEAGLSIYQKKYGQDEHAMSSRFYNEIGECYEKLGDYEKAKNYYERSLHLQLNKFQAGGFAIAEAYLSLASVYMITDNAKRAKGYIEKAHQIYLEKGGPKSYNIAISFNDLGNVHDNLKQYKQALKYYKKASDIILDIKKQGDTKLSIIDHNIGTTYNHMNRPENALIYHQRALAYRKKNLGLKQWNTIISYNAVAETLNHLGRHEEALDTVYQVLDILNYNLETPYQFSSVLNLTKLQETLQIGTLAYEKINQKENGIYEEKTLKFYDYLLALQDYIYQNSFTQTNHNYFLKTSFPIYEKSIKHLLSGNTSIKDEKAFIIAEKNKARHLAANLKKERIQKFITLPRHLIQKENRINTELTYFSNKIFELNATSQYDSLLNQYHDQVFELRREKEDLIKTFKTDYPSYFNLKYDQQIISLNDIQKKITSDQTLLEYFVGEKNIFVFIIQKDDFYVREIKKDFPLDQSIDTLRTSIYEYWTAPDLSRYSAKISYKKFVSSSRMLYQKLIEPVADKLTEQLIIIPDRKLNFIPFEVLLSSDAKTEENNYARLDYLLKKYQISYNYSVSLFAYLLDQKSSNSSNQLLSIAPIFNGPPQAFRSLAELRAGYGSLPYNQKEAKTVAALMGGKVLSGTQATKKAFLEHAPSSQIIHLATHSKSNDALGDYSYMTFQSSEDTSNTYDHLYARDLYNLKLKADMVVLSACESGLGELKSGEGVIGLARAFAYAGAKSTVTSLWSVSDRETTNLMELFYTNLKAGQTKDEALRNAKLNYLNTSKRNAPFFWAGFIPSGNMQTIVLQNDETRRSLQNLFIFTFLVVIIVLIFKFVSNNRNRS